MFIGVVLLAVYGSDGCEGRCDARCYNGKHDKCQCICCGRNHGVGLQQAAENIREMYEPLLESLKAQHRDVVRHPCTDQLSLFSVGNLAKEVLA